MSENGVRFDYPPSVPPNTPARKPEEAAKEDEGNYNSGFFADLFCWWRSRRERQLIEELRRIKSQNALLTEENWQQACLIEKLNRWMQASTLTAARIADQMGGPPPERRRRD